MRSIYFVRHGETIANEQNYFAGAMDVPLTELGVHQARQAGRYLKKTNFPLMKSIHQLLVVPRKLLLLYWSKPGMKKFLCISQNN